VILFDLGGVLLPFDRERRVRTIAGVTGRAPEAVRDFMASDIHRRLDLGLADKADLADAISDFAGRAIAPHQACALVLSVFEPPNLPLWGLAADLRREFQVGAFSDNPAMVKQVFPPGAVLDPVFLSCELGALKPAPEAFKAVEARLDVPADAILFIDDTLANVEQARTMGWDGVAFISNDQLNADLAVRGISA